MMSANQLFGENLKMKLNLLTSQDNSSEKTNEEVESAGQSFPKNGR